MKNILFTILLVSAAVALSAQDNVLIDKIIAVVGDKVVLKSDVEVQYEQYRQQGEVPANFRCQIIDQLLMQKLLMTQAEIDSVIVSDEEVEGELDRRMRYFISMMGSQEKLEEYYQKSVLEIKEEFRPAVKEQILAQRMQGKITGDVKITPTEVRVFFNNIPEDSLPYFNTEVQVGQIVLIAKPNEAQKSAAKQKLEGIRQRVIEGEDFGTMAVLYSDDPGTASNKGELPMFGRNDGFVSEFIGAAFRLKEPGDISDVFETQFGYHIIQLIEKKGERVRVRHILVAPKVSTADVQSAQRKAQQITRELRAGNITWAEAVQQYSDDERTKPNLGMITNPQTGDASFEIDQLGAIDKDLPFIIDTMKAGEFSEPVAYTAPQQNQGFRIVYLKSETLPHKANLQEDYSKIQSVALAEKKDKVIQEWIEEKAEKTYIRIDSSYRQCDEMNVWLSSNP